jgi:hypothetical protein
MDEIFYLQRHGGGAFTFSDCYSMPTQIRKYYVRKLSAEIAEENAKAEAARTGSTTSGLNQLASGKAPTSPKSPDYTAKAPRK